MMKGKVTKMTEILWDAALDCVKILPFLFLSYLAVEYTEHRMSQKTKNWIYRAGKAGPVLGGLIGIIPQCGFSAAAAGLFAGGIVTPGTLIAVFLSTSDEMLPVDLIRKVLYDEISGKDAISENVITYLGMSIFAKILCYAMLLDEGKYGSDEERRDMRELICRGICREIEGV